MLPELHRLLMALGPVYSLGKAKEFIYEKNVLNKKTFDNRNAVWHRLNHRYFKVQIPWIVSSLNEVATSGITSSNFISLSYLYYVLRDRLVHDFVITQIWELWCSGVTNISNSDFSKFINENRLENVELTKWRETTLNRLARNNLSALRDFGLLAGTAIKHIQRPTITPETVYHLLAILWAEGKRGRAILEAEDWKLFLWNDADTTHSLVHLSQLGWIKFERGGQTVILDMIRTPESMGKKVDDQ